MTGQERGEHERPPERLGLGVVPGTFDELGEVVVGDDARIDGEPSDGHIADGALAVGGDRVRVFTVHREAATRQGDGATSYRRFVAGALRQVEDGRRCRRCVLVRAGRGAAGCLRPTSAHAGQQRSAGAIPVIWRGIARMVSRAGRASSGRSRGRRRAPG